jgi:hypothetical protein
MITAADRGKKQERENEERHILTCAEYGPECPPLMPAELPYCHPTAQNDRNRPAENLPRGVPARLTLSNMPVNPPRDLFEGTKFSCSTTEHLPRPVPHKEERREDPENAQ